MRFCSFFANYCRIIALSFPPAFTRAGKRVKGRQCRHARDRSFVPVFDSPDSDQPELMFTVDGLGFPERQAAEFLGEGLKFLY
jgi:hypothetical protein